MKKILVSLLFIFALFSCEDAKNSVSTEKNKVLKTFERDSIIETNFGTSNPYSFQFDYDTEGLVDGYISNISMTYKDTKLYLIYDSQRELYIYYDSQKNFGNLEFHKFKTGFHIAKTGSTEKDFKLDRDLVFKVHFYETKWVWE